MRALLIMSLLLLGSAVYAEEDSAAANIGAGAQANGSGPAR